MNSLFLILFSNNVKSTVASGRIQSGIAGNGTVGLEFNFATSSLLLLFNGVQGASSGALPPQSIVGLCEPLFKKP